MDLSFFPAWPPTWPTAMAVAVLALFAAAGGEVAARWLRLPRLLGYLAAGALFGAGGYVLQLLKIEELPHSHDAIFDELCRRRHPVRRRTARVVRLGAAQPCVCWWRACLKAV